MITQELVTGAVAIVAAAAALCIVGALFARLWLWLMVDAGMSLWKLRAVVSRWRNGPMVRDTEGRFVSAAGELYAVEVSPMAGSDRLVGIMLEHGYSGAIPGTYVPQLFIAVEVSPIAVEAGIMRLLHRADELGHRFAAATASHGADAAPPVVVTSDEFVEEVAERTRDMVIEAVDEGQPADSDFE